ncbi:HEAT repeat domain-containing protein [Candidatus Bathyarchaeota archaeon A05DMB-2]|nr:HEAT repeat domain-containing protein [Candidatus Bathyarchaeota archaeon A05DMB-2]
MSFLQELFGSPNIEQLKAKHDIKGLIKALGYKKVSSVREKAAQALGKIGGDQVVMPLIDALIMDNDEKVHHAAAGALGQIGAPAVEPLIAALKDPVVGQRVIEALRQIGAPAIEPLITALRDKDHIMQQSVAEALKQIGGPEAMQALQQWERQIRQEREEREQQERVRQIQQERERQEREKRTLERRERKGKRITHLLILLESSPVGGESFFIKQLADNLYDKDTGKPYSEYMDADTKIALKVVGRQDFDDEYFLTALMFITWGTVEGMNISRQKFSGRGGNGTTVEAWSHP